MTSKDSDSIMSTKKSTAQRRLIRINRKKWARGNILNASNTGLWDENKQQGCCLGHAIRQVTHCSWRELNHIGELSTLVSKDKYSKSELVKKVVALEETCIDINDQKGILARDREAQLKREFSKQGFKLEFYN